MSEQNRFVELIPIVLQKQLQLTTPILQSTYLIYKSCEELCALVKCLPPYADDFCQAIVDLLFKHRESCHKLFLSIVEKDDPSGVSIYSNEWVKDLDINRHLRTMPAFDAFIRQAKERHLDEEDNADNIRFRQTKETETLLINFSKDEMIPEDICTNYKHIQLLATIHESLDWLYSKLVHYFDILDLCLNDSKHLDALIQTTGTLVNTCSTRLAVRVHFSDIWFHFAINQTEFLAVRTTETIASESRDLLQCLENHIHSLLRYPSRSIP